MCVLDKKVTFEEAKKIFKIANGNINLIKEKYEVAKASRYKNLVGFLIKAIEDNWNRPKFQNEHNNQVKTKFHNFKSRTSDYTAEELKVKDPNI